MFLGDSYTFAPQAHAANTASFLSAHGIKRVNIPNKQKSDDLLGLTAKLRQQVQGLDVCVHWRCGSRAVKF